MAPVSLQNVTTFKDWTICDTWGGPQMNVHTLTNADSQHLSQSNGLPKGPAIALQSLTISDFEY
jgi:hypothetical protein